MTDFRNPGEQWAQALEPGADCLAIERISETLTPAERAHVDACPRCAAELRLFQACERAATPEEAAAIAGIADALARRAGPSTRRAPAVIAGPAATWWRLAAVLVVAGGVAYAAWGRQPGLRDPGADVVYRSAAVELVAPAGDVPELPAAFVWTPVPGAVRYHVTVREVDGSVLWSESSTDSRLGIPPAVRQKIVSGKTITWDVVAAGRDGREVARSVAGRVRVVGRPPSAGE